MIKQALKLKAFARLFQTTLVPLQTKTLMQLPVRGIISDYFVTPMLQERQEKRLQASDSKEIFERVRLDHETLSYPQAVEILSDLAYIIIPFDKTLPEFQQLISRLKLVLSNQTGNVKLDQLVDAVTRLNIDSCNQLIRSKIAEGNYSRSPADICSIQYFLATQHKVSHQQRDVEMFSQVLNDLKHMQVHNLQIEQLDLLLRAFAYSVEPSFLHQIKDTEQYFKQVEEFLPKLVDQSHKEMLRCNIIDIITLMDSFYKLWDKNVFQRSLSLKTIFNNCDMYLSQYLGQSKKDITGTQFCQLVDLVAKGHSSGLHQFSQKVIHRLQMIFCNDNADLYVFSMRDIVKLFKGFESINDYLNRDKVHVAIVELVLESRIYEDEAFLDFVMELSHKGLIEKYQDVAVKARVYFQERFDFMERKTILGYLELFKELGMLFDDKEIMLLIRNHLLLGFHNYELAELFQVFKLLSNNFYRDDPETLRLIEDAVKIRVSEVEQRQQLKAESVRDLVQGLRVQVDFNKRLDASLRSIINSSYVLESDHKLFVEYLSYIVDFESKVDDALRDKLTSAFQTHLSSYTPADKAHLMLYGAGLLPLVRLKPLELPKMDQLDQDTCEKLALLGLEKLDKGRALAVIDDIEKEFNLMEIIESYLNAKNLKFEKEQLVCDDRLRAAFVIEDTKTIVDVANHQFSSYLKDGVRNQRLRGRKADEIAKEHGYYGGYRLVSLIELEFSKDESKYLELALFPSTVKVAKSV